MMAQMGRPDMCLPIQYALTYPERVAGVAKGLELEDFSRLSFEKPNLETFRALAIGFEVAQVGGTAAAVFNAANEAAVAAFLAGRISFDRLVPIVEEILNRAPAGGEQTLQTLIEADAWVRRQVAEQIGAKTPADRK